MDSNFRYRGTKAVNFRSIPGIAGYPDAQTIDAFVNTAQVGPFFLPHSSISARKVVAVSSARSLNGVMQAPRVYATLEVARTRAENALTLTAAMISPVDRATGTASDRRPTSNSSSMIA